MLDENYSGFKFMEQCMNVATLCLEYYLLP